MRTRTVVTTITLFSLAFAALWSGCADLQKDLPAATTGDVKVHPLGWADSAASEFHGNAIRANNWDMTSCQTCHSSKYTGGTSGVSCTTCHNDPAGPENCITCHGSSASPAPPRDIDGYILRTARGVGAHQVHLTGTSTSRQVTCTECHNVPGSVTTAGHVDTPLPAEVPLNGMFAKWPTGNITPAPVYTSSNLTCSGTYCHGNFVNGNPTNDVIWNGAAGTGAACGSCHGSTTAGTTAQKALPKTSPDGDHPNNTKCVWCHSATVDNTAKIINATKHVDGTIDLFRITTQADCSHCHGSATNAAPPNDLSGNSAVTSRGVGAHQAHLIATFAKNLKCAECHSVPATLDYSGADGHMDAVAGIEVAMNDTLARIVTLGATPAPLFNSGSLTCANTYCHGSFTNGNLSNVVTWNGTAGTGAACGSCHGDTTETTNQLKAMPKNTNNGGTHTTNANCVACHNQVIDASGNIINSSLHMNGKATVFGEERTNW